MSVPPTAQRVNYAHFGEFVGQPVRVVGKIGPLYPGGVEITTTDGHQVRLQLNSSCPKGIEYVEVFCKVTKDNTLTQIGPFVDMGPFLDMKLANEAIELTFHPELREFFSPIQ